jgi:hypothetical protein
MHNEYDSAKEFQRKLLSLYIRHPKQVRDHVEPSFFSSQLHINIAKWVSERYKKHPDERLTKASLRELVKGKLGRKLTGWPEYKHEIKALFEHTTDDDFVAESAAKFARERKWREALVEGEKDINAEHYDNALRRFEKLRELNAPAKDSSGPKLKSYSIHQFLNQEETADADGDYLVFPILLKDGAMLVLGLPKELKSWFGLELANAAASGKKAFGYFRVPRPAKTLYIQVEDPTSLTRKRVDWVTQHGSGFRSPATLTNLRIIPRCPLNFSDPNWCAQLEMEIQKFKPGLIVLDVLRRLFHGNVNDMKETAEFLRVLDRLRDTYHCATVLVHHARKNESGPMQAMGLGSVNFGAWPEVLVYTTNKRKVGNISVADLEMEGKDVMESNLEIVVDTEANPVVSVRQKGGGSIALLQRLIAENPGINQRTLGEKSGMEDRKLRATLKEGVKKEYWVEKKGKGEGNSRAYYPSNQRNNGPRF